MTTITCKACEHSGLAILFTYLGAAATDSAIAPEGASKVTTANDMLVADAGLPKLQHARYLLRTLREGYLHIYHEKPPKWLVAQHVAAKSQEPEAGYWEVFRIKPGGALIPQNHPSFATAEPFSCTEDKGAHIYTVLAYRLRQAHESGVIWVAYSANLWDATLRTRNKANPAAMQPIDIPAILKGKMTVRTAKADGAWINQHIAEFALPSFNHYRTPPKHGFTSHAGEGQRIEARFAQLDGGHPATKGRSIVFALNDTVGTAATLSDIEIARYRQMSAYIDGQEHPLSAMLRIDMLHQQSLDTQRMQSTTQYKLLSAEPCDKQGNLIKANGAPLLSKAQSQEFPPMAERQGWAALGVMSFMGYGQTIGSQLIPSTSRMYQMDGYAGEGYVIAPIEDIAQLAARRATRKMDRLYQRDQLEKFRTGIKGSLDAFLKLGREHCADRVKVLQTAALQCYFEKHFDPNDPNPVTEKYNAKNPMRALRHEPCGMVYMREASAALIGAEAFMEAMEEATTMMLDPAKHPGWSWALKAMVANQAGIYSELSSFLAHESDWVSNPDQKLDKSYDTLKGLLFYDGPLVNGTSLAARFGWTNSVGVGLSFGIQGALAGAAAHMVAAKIARANPNFAKTVGEGAAMAEKFIDRVTGDVRDVAIKKQLGLSTRLQSWCLQQSMLLDAHLKKKPPARPVYARVTLSVEQAVEVLVDAKRQGEKFNRTTRSMLAEWQKMPSGARNSSVQLDFLTTDHALRDAQSVKGVAATADSARIAVLSHTAGAPLVSLSAAQLGELYRDAHRYDAVKTSLVDFVKTSAPKAAERVLAVASQGAKVPASALRGVPTWSGQFSIFGALLQWRAMNKNSERIDALEKRLQTMPGLTAGQRQAISDTKLLLQLGFWDNWCGISGGVAELSAIGAKALAIESTAAVMSAGAAFAGCGGALMNAAQNWHKAEGKLRDGDLAFYRLYRGVAFFYASAGLALFGNGVAILGEWLAKRAAIKAGVEFAAGRILTFGLRALPGIGWGATLVAFIAEGIVSWFDRTALEAWVENCYFGDEPKWRSQADAAGVRAETLAFESAMQATHDEAAALENT